jgi:glycosyltransferase involved in cell wall biosynthesis
VKPCLLHILNGAELGGNERLCELIVRNCPAFQHRVLALSEAGPAVALWSRAGADVQCIKCEQSRWHVYRSVKHHAARIRPAGAVIWSGARIGLVASACWAAGCRQTITCIGNPMILQPANRQAAWMYSILPGAKTTILIAVSNHVAESLQKEAVFARFRSRVIYNAVDVDAFPYSSRRGGNGSPVVGMLARLDKIKDHRTLLLGWGEVLARFPQATLELAGDGDEREALSKLAAALGIENQVRFLGRAMDVPGTLARWDLMVHSGTDREGFGVSMIEAMASGCPLVATDIGPVREVTADGRVAILVPPRDPAALAGAIVAALSDGPGTRHRAQAARTWVEANFSASQMVRGYLEALGLG